MKILFHADAFVHTGFGRVTHGFGERLIDRGHEIDALAINWRGDPEVSSKMKPWMTNRFNTQDVYGLNRVQELCRRVRPDVYVIYNDLPVAHEIIRLVPREIPVLLYFPIDCVRLPQWWLSPLRLAAEAVTFTHWAVEEVARAEVVPPPITVIPHGIDTATFYPIRPDHPGTIDVRGEAVPVRSPEEARAALGIADRFVILWADRNSQRKNVHDFFAAVAPFVREHPETLLYLHCKPLDEGGDISLWVERYGLARNVRFTPDLDTWIGVSDATLNVIYNAAHVRVSTALGEGFGLHGGEAASAGIPQIAPEFSCFPEVLGPGALYVSAKHPYTTARGVDLAYPAVGEITDHLRALYADDGLRRRLGRAGRRWVEDRYNWDRLTDDFEAALERALARGNRRVLAA